MEESVITKLKDLNLINRFLFDEVMEDKGAYQASGKETVGERI